ncbi:MAG: DEAD/DEAH box helicase [Candidatus Aenigmatarchaeota archaeon]
MDYVSHPLIKHMAVQAREYQTSLVNSALKKNTLVVVSTGLGKTLISILVAAERLSKFPEGKVMVLSPTRPLCSQIHKSYQEAFEMSEKKITLITGSINPEDREYLYRMSRIVVSTPQCISNDLKHGRINLSDFCLVTFDEAQHSIGNYSYTIVAKHYIEQAKNPLVLGLTASPGGTEQKIREICKNLFIEAVEIKSEADDDVKPYVKEVRTEIFKVDLSGSMIEAQNLLKNTLKRRIDKLKGYNIFVRTKRDMLEAQKKVSDQLNTEKKPILFYIVSLIVECVKISHVLELLETQSIKSVESYIEKVSLKKTKSDKAILGDVEFLKALDIIKSCEEHPKIEKLKEIIKKEIEDDKNVSIIVFSHYRDNIFNLQNLLEKICRPTILIGQGGDRGLSQKEQIDVIKDFNAGYYNCLITSPIGEEGLHIPSADIAIFYDSVPSEIRTIQRRGRVGRTKIGKIIFLLAKNTRDEAYYWSAQRKEKKMREVLKDMQSKSINPQQSIDSFIETKDSQ